MGEPELVYRLELAVKQVRPGNPGDLVVELTDALLTKLVAERYVSKKHMVVSQEDSINISNYILDKLLEDIKEKIQKEEVPKWMH